MQQKQRELCRSNRSAFEFRLVPKSVTLNDLARRNGRYYLALSDVAGPQSYTDFGKNVVPRFIKIHRLSTATASRGIIGISGKWSDGQ